MYYRSHPTGVKLVRSDDQDPNTIGTLEAYIAVFNSDSCDMGFVERIAPGAFKKSIATNDIVALVNHDRGTVVGRLSAGTLQLKEDDHGLLATVSVPNTTAGRDLMVLVARQDQKYCSFGFNVRAEDMEWTNVDGVDHCLLKEVDCGEVSVGVTFPAYEATSMKLRSFLDDHRNNLRERAKARLRILAQRHR